MLKPSYIAQFKRDYKIQQRRGKNLDLLDEIIRDLVKEQPLAIKNQDHPLRGNYKGYRECHIDPDWLLIYKIEGNDIYFIRTGSHSDLFK